MSDSRREEGHVLVIEQKGIDYSIRHLHSCATVEVAGGLPGDGPVIEYTCLVGQLISAAGLIDNGVEWQEMEEGRYHLIGVVEHTPSLPTNGGEEWDVWLEVEPPTPLSRFAAEALIEDVVRDGVTSLDPNQGGEMQKGTAVNFNDGKHDLLALVRGGTGDGTDLVVFTKDGAEFKDNVPRRDPSDYGAEGGGHTWHPIA